MAGSFRSRSMDQSAQQAATQSRMLRRSSARSAILDAARRLATRGGTADLSLTAVAAEAGFGPSTVFGHFRNRDELLIAIIAEDMAGLASQMHGIFSAHNQPNSSETNERDDSRRPLQAVPDEVEIAEISPEPPTSISEKRRLASV